MEFVTGFPPEPAQVVYSFNNYPFFAGNHSLELSYSYITDLVLNAVPYIGVGTGLSVICLIILIVRFTCFRKKSDKAESSQVEMEANILLRLISTLSIAIIACGAAFGFLGTHVLVKSLGHDENALDGSIHWMTASANFFQQTFSSQGLQAQLNTSYPAYSDILQAMQEIEQEATDFKSTMDSVLNSIENTFVTVKKIFFLFLLWSIWIDWSCHSRCLVAYLFTWLSSIVCEDSIVDCGYLVHVALLDHSFACFDVIMGLLQCLSHRLCVL